MVQDDPAEVVVTITTNDIYDRVYCEVLVLQGDIDEQIRAVRTGVNTGPITSNRIAVYADELEAAQMSVEQQLKAMYQELCNLKPAETEATLRTKKSWADAMRSELLSAKMDLAAAKDTMNSERGATMASSRVDSGESSPASSIGTLAFKKRDFPSFSGELEDYPSFKKR